MLPLNSLEFSDLGGIHTDKALTNYAKRDAIHAIGGYYDVRGQFTHLQGGTKFNTTAYADLISGIFHFKTSTADKVLIGIDQNLYATNPSTQVATFGAAIKGSLTTGGYFSFAKLNDYAFICNEKDGLFKTLDASTVTNAGITTPAAACTATPQTSGGSLADGVYKIAYTYLNDSDANNEIESNPSAEVTATVAGGSGSGSIDLTVVAVSGDSQVTKRRIYMTAVGGAILSFNATIANNTATIITITADSAGALLEYDHDVPPTALKKVVVYRNRLFGFKDKTLYWSKEFKPWYWPQGEFSSSQTVDIHTAEIGNEDITNIKPFFNELLITFDGDIWILSGTNEITFRVDRIRSDERRGCTSKYGLKIVGNYAMMIGRNGFYITDGIKIHNAGNPLQDYFLEESNDSNLNINKADIENAIVEYDENKNLVMLQISTSSNTNNNMGYYLDAQSLRIDPETNEMTADWSRREGIPTTASAFVRKSGIDRWYRADDDGYVWRMDTLDGDGSNITSTSTGSNSSTTLNDTNQSWTVNIYTNRPIEILEGTGIGQTRTISSNTATQVTVSVAWTTTPDETSVYSIGGILFRYEHAWDNYGNPTLSKRWRYAKPRLNVSGTVQIDTTYGFDFIHDVSTTETFLITELSLWDVSFWDEDYFDGVAVSLNKYSVPSSKIHEWSNYRIEHKRAGEIVNYMGVEKLFQIKGVR